VVLKRNGIEDRQYFPTGPLSGKSAALVRAQASRDDVIAYPEVPWRRFY
jgi:hypothetical protein